MKHDLVIVDIGPRKPRRRAHSALTRAPRASGKRVPSILLMDDNIPARQAVERVLRSNGWRVEWATRPEEALVMLSENVPDLLITELATGTVSGWDLLFHETIERPSLPIFVISDLPANEVYGADQLAREYFQKPIDMERLVRAVRRCVEETAIIRIK